MTYPEVQFVAAPEDGAEVLFDFNDNMPGTAPAQIVAGSFTLGTPSLVGDPDGLGVQYGSRTVGFSLLIYGNRQQAKETQTLLARTFMLRRRGWLRVRLDEFSAPVWLRTYTPTPAELDFSLIRPDGDVDAWQLEVEVAAEPFIRGERINLGTWTINNDPAHSINPMGVTLPAIVGDAPAPLRISAAFSNTRNQADILWSVAAVPTGYAPTVWQIGASDGWTLGGDTRASTADANYSNGSFRWVDFAVTEAMSGRLGGPAPSTPLPGRYRVFLRAARNATVGKFAFRLGYRTPAGDKFNGSRVATMDRSGATWVDLGEFDFPLPRTDADVPVASAVPSIALEAQRLSGTEWVALDALMLVPVDIWSVPGMESWEKADVLVSEFGSFGPQAGIGESQVWDGDAEVTFRSTATGVADGLSMAANRGRFPTVRPGVANRLTLIEQARTVPSDSNPDLLGFLADVTVSYQPRWLWLGDA